MFLHSYNIFVPLLDVISLLKSFVHNLNEKKLIIDEIITKLFDFIDISKYVKLRKKLTNTILKFIPWLKRKIISHKMQNYSTG